MALLIARYTRLRLTLPRRFARVPLPELLASLGGRGASVPRADAGDAKRDAARVDRWLRGADQVLCRVPGLPSTCLYRALARYDVHRRRGLAVRFVLGVRPGVDDIVGHAWIEEGGQVLGETLEEPFQETFVFPPRESQP